MKRTALVCLLFLLPLSINLLASPIITLHRDSPSEVRGNLGYLKDTDHRLTLAEVQLATFASLRLDQIPSFGLDAATHWFKISINNTAGQEKWLLEVAYPTLDEVVVYSKGSDGSWLSEKSGDHFPISGRKVLHHNLVFPISFGQGPSDLFIQVRTTSSVQVPIALWPVEEFYQSSFRSQFANGLFYGILLIMIFYNLFLYLSTRDLNTLYYSLTLLTGANVVAFFQGYGFFYLYPELPMLTDFFAIISGPLFIIASGLLARSFLRLQFFSPRLNQALIAITLVTLLLVSVLLIFPGVISLKALHILTILNCSLILISALYCLLKSYRPARYFFLAWVSLLVAAVLFSLKNLGYYPSNALSNSALYVGGILQTLLISLALGDRINLLTKENQEAKEKELEFKQSLNEQLEKEIKLRTAEIHQANVELKEANQVKDKLFSVISHDLKGPLHSLKGTLNILRMGALNPDEFNQLTEAIESQLSQTSYLLDNLLHWSKTQMQGEAFAPLKLDLKDILSETLSLFKTESERKGVEIVSHLKTSMLVFADANMMSTVLRNLISNALKFTDQGEITIEVVQDGKQVIISVKDTGLGIPNRYLNNLFTLQGVTTVGTREEKGTGIGLVLCKEFVEKNGGRIWVESKEGEGSNFYFSIPIG